MEEEWFDIPGYEGLYQITKNGIIRSLTYQGKIRDIPLIRKPNINRYGYAMMLLTKNKIRKNLSVHRLVALTFIPNPNNLPEVNHIDGNKLNNNVSNLEWCTSKENIEHAFKTGLKKTGEVKHDSINVVLLNTGELFGCITNAAKEYKTTTSEICACCKQKQFSAGKFNDEPLVWRYENDYLTMSESDIENALYKADRRIICITTGNIYESSLKAEEDTKCDHSHIIKCCKGKQKTTKGLEWKYYRDFIKNN